MNGECKCRDNYQGQYCQYKAAVSSRMWIWFVVYFFLIALIGVVVFITWQQRSKIQEFFAQRAAQQQQAAPSGPPVHEGNLVSN